MTHMNILIVDDQADVVKGILNNVSFGKLGFDVVKTANSGEEALGILEGFPIDVLLTDIEMPKMSGLDLIAHAKEKQPKLLSVLLTSHARFSYAQESITLGCFRYIVQPAPYEEIESCLRSAVSALNAAQEAQRERDFGRLFKTHEQEFVSSSIERLYSKNHTDVLDAQKVLNDYGYHISDTSAAELLFVNLFANQSNASLYPSQNHVISAIAGALPLLCEDPEMEFLVSVQPCRQYSLLALSNKQDMFPIQFSKLENFYRALCDKLYSVPVACYVSDVFACGQLYSVAKDISQNMRENISKQTGLFFCQSDQDYVELPVSLFSYVERWTRLLNANQRSLLKDNIWAFIHENIEYAPNRYQKLFELHQSLLQMFFRYFYDKGIEVAALFDDRYTYKACIESYSTVEELEKMADFMLAHLDCDQVEKEPLSYIEKGKNYIMSNLNAALTVKEVAEHVHLNPEYFTRIFKKETGIGVKDYIIACKMSMAKDLLINSNLPVYMVSLELGYSNFSYFDMLFKQKENMTPLEYRRLHKKGTAGPN